MDICDDIVVFRNGKDVATIDYTQDVKDPQQIVDYITGEARTEEAGKRESAATEEILLKVENLKHGRYIRDVSFTLRKGEILGVGGLAGQGQHELMLALAGNYPGLSGHVEINGRHVELTKPSRAIENDILLVPGDRQLEGLFLQHSVFRNLVFPRVGLKGHPLRVPEKRYKEEANEIIEALSVVTHSLESPVNTLSGGNQQKIVVGKWLPFDIDVLLLADPAKGVDVGAKHDLYEYILRLVHDKEMGVILYASDNEELIDYCDRLMIMYEGQVVTTLEGEDINEDAIVTASLQVRSDETEGRE
jgi:ribose transport system ATP-binding protein